MAKEHDLLRRVIKRGSKQKHDWHQVLGAVHRVVTKPTPESEKVLRKILDYDGEIGLSGRHVPHALTPADMLRSLALQVLAMKDAGRDHPKHRGAIRRLRRRTSSDLLAEIARIHLVR